MGLLRNRHDDAAEGARFQMRAQLLTIGDDFWIETEDGEKGLQASTARRCGFARHSCSRTRPAVRWPSSRSASCVRDKMEIERDGDSVATVKKAWSASATAS